MAGIVPYLHALGISHLYLSPILQAAPGSTHGYDVVNPGRVNTELGGAAAFERLRRTVAEHAMGIVVDIVPNHLAITTPHNPWWWDVLENGQASRYASYFDIDWMPPEAKLRDVVLVPVLSDHYGRELERGAIALQRTPARIVVTYGDHRFPLAPRTLDTLLEPAAARSGADDLAALADAFASLPSSTASDDESVRRRHRGKEWLGAQLQRLWSDDATIARAVDEVIAAVNQDVERLHALLERQNYRLAFWRTAERELGYRRFFDINSLIGLRVEDQTVFADTHALPLAWLATGAVDGLRIDHIDGLRDPVAYLERLHAAAPEAWIVVEKILSEGESLPREWRTHGTTGYDALNDIDAVLIDTAAQPALSDLYRDILRAEPAWDDVAYEQKHLIMQQALASDVNRLAALLVDICERHRRHRDYTRHELHEALREVIANFRVYRTYVRPGTSDAIHAVDAERIARSIADATQRRPDIDPSLFKFLHALLTNQIAGRLENELVARVQQLTGPVMAKGVEDTAFYRYNRFIALNEVGGDPAQFGLTIADFHRRNQEAQRIWPQRMVATSTHDTKRSEDVRARLAVLSEIPAPWAAAVREWIALGERHRCDGIPDADVQYLFYQTLVGAWPLSVDRAVAFMLKAARESKQRTSWTRPDPDYEAALERFVRAVLQDAALARGVTAFVDHVAERGQTNALAQTLLKLTVPGIPDVYQGTELWQHTLVDPDNRQPVDFAHRAECLARLSDVQPAALWKRRADGRAKMWVMRQALATRRAHPGCFGRAGGYTPVDARGPCRDNLVAFRRGRHVLTAVPRLLSQVGDGWPDTILPLEQGGVGAWRNALTGSVYQGNAVTIATLFRDLPVALLVCAAACEGEP